MLSAAFSVCSVAERSIALPMPEFSFSSPSCSVTIPISANASRPIHIRPRISRSSRRWVDSVSTAPSSPTTRPSWAPAAGRGRPWPARG